MTKIQITKTKTNAREAREKHERADGIGLLLFFVLNFIHLNFEFVSNFVLHEACFGFIF
jgi:hypothetical protein